MGGDKLPTTSTQLSLAPACPGQSLGMALICPFWVHRTCPRDVRARGQEIWPPWATPAPWQGLTQFVDANLLQILPRQVRHDGDGVVAVVHQLFVVLGQADGTEPIHQVSLRRAWRCCREQQGTGSAFIHPLPAPKRGSLWLLQSSFTHRQPPSCPGGCSSEERGCHRAKPRCQGLTGM